jgi:hypothetical protein
MSAMRFESTSVTQDQMILKLQLRKNFPVFRRPLGMFHCSEIGTYGASILRVTDFD